MKSAELLCGHQYHAICWSEFLQEKVKSDGPTCVFAQCCQLNCNIKVPHSFFLKHLVDEEAADGINYKKKYINWVAL